jgi:hypothetical protein
VAAGVCKNEELLALCNAQKQSWTVNEEKTLGSLLAQHSGINLVNAVAEHAASARYPIQFAFWKNKLIDLLRSATHLIQRVRAHLARYYEASVNRRLDLIDLISALEASLL